jgi:3-oxoacyl-[acyl-carrier-protein] synthase II
MSRRVGISGLGPVTAFGIGIDPLWSALLEGRTAIDTIRQFDASAFGCPLAAEVADDFRIRDHVPKHYRKAIKVMCRDTAFAIVGSNTALAHAGLTTAGTDRDADPTMPPNRMGCQIGAGLICSDVNELGVAMVTSQTDDGFDLGHWGRQGMKELTPLWLLKSLPNMLACHVTIVHECRGPSNTITCWESSAALSLMESTRVIQRHAADACLSGGAESRQNVLAFHRQVQTGRLTDGARGAERAVLPFHCDADGTVLGEGGGLLIVEALDHIEQRGGTLLAEILGTGSTQTIDDWTGLGADATSIADAINLALAQANLSPDDIDAIVPFGSGIPAVDDAERCAMVDVFGDGAATKELILLTPAVGNCCSGHGSVQLTVAAKCLQEGMLPARRGDDAIDGLLAGPVESRKADLRHVLVLSTSMGGQNTAVILGGGA